MKYLCLLLLILTLLSCDRDGVRQEFYQTGELMAEYEIRNGKRNGFFKYYLKDGTIRLKYTNKDNKKNGQLIQYYRTGEIESKALLGDDQTVWSEHYDHNGILLNRYEGNQATFYTYFSNQELAEIEYMTNVYDSVKSDSLIYIRLDSGYFYTMDPNKKALRFVNNEDFFIVENLQLSPEFADTVMTWKEVERLKKVALGKDTLDKGYIPTVDKSKDIQW